MRPEVTEQREEVGLGIGPGPNDSIASQDTPRTWTSSPSKSSRCSRISRNSPVQTPEKANGKKTITTCFSPRKSPSDTVSPYWFRSAKSGATSPTPSGPAGSGVGSLMRASCQPPRKDAHREVTAPAHPPGLDGWTRRRYICGQRRCPRGATSRTELHSALTLAPPAVCSPAVTAASSISLASTWSGMSGLGREQHDETAVGEVGQRVDEDVDEVVVALANQTRTASATSA